MALHILSELLNKLPDAFGEQFTRLGLHMHIANLACSSAAEEEGEGGGASDAKESGTASKPGEQPVEVRTRGKKRRMKRGGGGREGGGGGGEGEGGG